MKITSDQLDILNSFSVTRLKDDDSLLREVNAFENIKNENLVDYLVGDAFDDDAENRCACYVVRDGAGEILCYFSIKCGLLYSEFEELKKFEKFKNHKIKLMELEQRSDDAQVREYIGEIKAKLKEAKALVSGIIDQRIRVSTSFLRNSGLWLIATSSMGCVWSEAL